MNVRQYCIELIKLRKKNERKKREAFEMGSDI